MPKKQEIVPENFEPVSPAQREDAQPSQRKTIGGKTIAAAVMIFLVFFLLTFLGFVLVSGESIDLGRFFSKTKEEQISIDKDFSDVPFDENEILDGGEEVTSNNANKNTDQKKKDSPETNRNANTNTEETDLVSGTRFESRAMPIAFSYPSGWSLWEDSSPLSELVQLGDFIVKPEQGLASRIPGHKLEVTMVQKPSDQALEVWITSMDTEYGVSSNISDVTIDGFPSKVDAVTYDYFVAQALYIPLGDGTDRVILFTLYGPEATSQDFDPLFNTFVKSIQITESQ